MTINDVAAWVLDVRLDGRREERERIVRYVRAHLRRGVSERFANAIDELLCAIERNEHWVREP